MDVSNGVGEGRIVALAVGRGVAEVLGRIVGEGVGRGPMKALPSNTTTAVMTTPMAMPVASARFIGGSWTSWQRVTRVAACRFHAQDVVCALD
jgi:hypothetical protein